jgi:hypothetical protein
VCVFLRGTETRPANTSISDTNWYGFSKYADPA